MPSTYAEAGCVNQKLSLSLFVSLIATHVCMCGTGTARPRCARGPRP